MRKPSFKWMLPVSILILTSLACSLGGPVAESTPFPTLEATALAQALESSIAITQENQTAVITLDEQEISSYLAQKIAEQPDAPIHSPQVVLQNGQMEIFGVASAGFLQANFQIVLAPVLDVQGKPSIDLISANFGPVPVPASLQDYLTGLLNDAILDGFGANADQLQILEIQIEDGLLITKLQQNS